MSENSYNAMRQTRQLRANVLGVGVSAVNLEEATTLLLDAAAKRQKGMVCVTGVHGISEAQKDPRFHRILNGAFLNVPDGMPMSWMGWLQGFQTMDRVYGPDLMLAISRESVGCGLTHFYYGGGEGVADVLKEKMEQRFPGLQVVGTFTPPYRPLSQDEAARLREMVDRLKPDFFWVGLSTPKQEVFMADYLSSLNVSLMLAVGAAFDFHAGRVKQAPRWMQRSGLEWFYRLRHEPRRLWKRYLVNNPLFVYRIALQLSGLRKYRLPPKEEPGEATA